jgi:hypothetical protein
MIQSLNCLPKYKLRTQRPHFTIHARQAMHLAGVLVSTVAFVTYAGGDTTQSPTHVLRVSEPDSNGVDARTGSEEAYGNGLRDTLWKPTSPHASQRLRRGSNNKQHDHPDFSKLSPQEMANFFILPEYKIVFCAIEKVGRQIPFSFTIYFRLLFCACGLCHTAVIGAFKCETNATLHQVY